MSITAEQKQNFKTITLCSEVQWNLLMWTLENKDTCIIQTRNCGPKWHFIISHDLENQDTLIIWTFFADPKVSIMHRFHCKKL